MKTAHTTVIIGSTSTSKTIRVTGLGLHIVPTAVDVPTGVAVIIKILHKFISKKSYLQTLTLSKGTFRGFRKMYQKSLEDEKQTNYKMKTLQIFKMHKKI